MMMRLHFWRSEEYGVIPFLLLLKDPLLPGTRVPVRVVSMGKKNLFKSYLYLSEILDAI